MKPKIYISHPRLSLEETAKMVGVSKRRLKELMVIIANPVVYQFEGLSILEPRPSEPVR
jgi:hypothetical protein